MSKKILFLEDLYNFYSNNYKRSVHYSADKTGSPIVVQALGRINFSEDDSKEGLTPVTLLACHTNVNRNGSCIKEEVMNKALSSFKNRPILGFIHVVNDQYEFYSHNMHEDDNGDVVYDERPVGVIPESCNAHLVDDDETGNLYVEVDGYLYDEYSHASEILKREQECSVSVELYIKELSYDSKEGVLDIEDFIFQGVTILGKTPDGEDVIPGMAKSNIKLKDFSVDNSMFASIKNELNELKDKLDSIELSFSDIQNSKEGGNTVNEELETKDVEEVTPETEVEFEEESVDESETKPVETFDDDPEDPDPDEPGDEEDPSDEDDDDESDDDDSEDDSDDDSGDDSGDDTTPTYDEQYGSDEDVKAEPKKKFEITIGDKVFALSMQDKIYSLNELVNATYSEVDNTFYNVIVYDDYVVMQDWYSGKFFKQSYSEGEGVFSLVGDRIPVFTEFVTEEEMNSLNEMRDSYEEFKQFKADSEEKTYFSLDGSKNVKVFANMNGTCDGRYGDLFSKR